MIRTAYRNEVAAVMGVSWVTALLKAVLLAGLPMAIGACSSPAPTVAHRQHGEAVLSIYVVAHDGHTGIALRRADIPAGLWPESRDFPQAEFLEVGWGARDYYMGRDDGFFGALKAALGHTQSVLHVVGFRGDPAQHFRGSEVIELSVTADGLDHMVRAINDAYDRAGAAVAAPLGPGQHGDSRFYPAWQQFNLLNTCNVWTARVLRSGGLPVEDAITREGLMSQARDLARRHP
jgi:uncharacterized protein (TIGR02117 family)